MRRAQLLSLAIGVAVTSVVAWRLDLPRDDVVQLLGLAAGGALVAAVVGFLVLISLRRASIGTQAVVVAMTAVGGTMAGVGLAADAMFVSSHDLGALVVVSLGSATVAVSAALGFGGRIGAASTDLVALTRRLGAGATVDAGDRPVSTELARLAAELEAASLRLEESRRREREIEAARRQLVAGVSHDLRTPLTGIRAMVEAIEDGVVADPGEVAAYLGSIRTETERLARLVDDLFELSRIEAGALDLHVETVALGDLVEEAVAASAAVAGRRGVRLVGDVGADVAPVAVAPPDVVRAFRNLLDNAIRHTEAGGSVRVVVEQSPDATGVEVSFEDECGGIPADDLARVFDPAFRGDAARSSGDHGGGLGLTITKGIVEAHDGTIRVANTGNGCRFTVWIPHCGGNAPGLTKS